MNIQPLESTADNDKELLPLFLPHGLFLKPYARLNVSVALPQVAAGNTVSNWDLMEKLRSMIKPARFAVLKVSKSTLEAIRFEGELDGGDKVLAVVLQQLDNRNIRLANFKELLKVRANRAKETFPQRSEWDTYFKDARDADDKVPGQRPDTLRLSNLPIRWFRPRHQEDDETARPSENIFKRIFEKFGNVRAVDIPMCDPYRKHMKSYIAGVKTLAFDQSTFFEGYVQFEDYAGFAATMRALRNQKLVRKEDKYWVVNITVDFDRDRHLSDASIKRRQVVRDRCIAKEQAKEEEERKLKVAEVERLEKERQKEAEIKQLELDRQLERENKRKEKQLLKLRSKELIDMSSKLRAEQKAVALAQRRMESVRVLRALFERIEIKAAHTLPHIKNENGASSAPPKPRRSAVDPHATAQRAAVRDKCIRRFADEFDSRKQALEIARSTGIFRAVLKTGGDKRSPSGSSISSDDSVLSDSRQRKKKKHKKKHQKLLKRSSPSAAASVSSGMSAEEDIVEPKPPMALLPHPTGGGFPVFNPETGQWMVGGMGMYAPYGNPYAAAAARADYYAMQQQHHQQQQPHSYQYRGGPRGGGGVVNNVYQRGGIAVRGMGMVRGGSNASALRGGRGNYQSYNQSETYYNSNNRHANDQERNKDGGHHQPAPQHYRRATDRPRYSHSPSARGVGGRARSRQRSRGAGGGGGGGGRSRSRSRPRRSHRSRSRSKGAAKSKLASTLRQSDSSERWSSRSRSVSRSKARRSWSRRKSSSSSSSRSRSRSRTRGGRNTKRNRRSNRSRSRSRSRSASSRSRSRQSRRSRSRSLRRSSPSKQEKPPLRQSDQQQLALQPDQQQPMDETSTSDKLAPKSGDRSAEQSSRSSRSHRSSVRSDNRPNNRDGEIAEPSSGLTAANANDNPTKSNKDDRPVDRQQRRSISPTSPDRGNSSRSRQRGRTPQVRRGGDCSTISSTRKSASPDVMKKPSSRSLTPPSQPEKPNASNSREHRRRNGSSGDSSEFRSPQGRSDSEPE